MKVGPEPQASVASASRPETQESRFRVEKVDEIGQHGIAIGGMFISNNCNTILLVMSLIFIIGGVIFTAISYRPQVSDEDMQQYRDRQMSEDVSQVKFIYSEKATNFCEISIVDLSYVLINCQIYGGYFAKFCGLLRIYKL